MEVHLLGNFGTSVAASVVFRAAIEQHQDRDLLRGALENKKVLFKYRETHGENVLLFRKRAG